MRGWLRTTAGAPAITARRCTMCCVPTINVTGVTVNTTTNVATLALDAPLPDRQQGEDRTVHPAAFPAHTSGPWCVPAALLQLLRGTARSVLRHAVHESTGKGPVLVYAYGRDCDNLQHGLQLPVLLRSHSRIRASLASRKAGCPLLWYHQRQKLVCLVRCRLPDGLPPVRKRELRDDNHAFGVIKEVNHAKT